MKDISKMLSEINLKVTPSGKDDENLCIVCYVNPPDTVLMPCGHGGVCYECSLSIWEADTGCYLCREEITEVL